MCQNKLLVLLILLLIPCLSKANFISTYSIDSVTIKQLVQSINSSTLVLINVDNTVIMPKSTMFRNNNPASMFMSELLVLASNRPEINERIAQLMLQRQMILTESNWPLFIKQLQDAKALVFGFVAPNPAFKLIPNFEEWQYNKLTTLNIYFTNTVNNQEMLRFDEKAKSSPSFYKGIIFTSTWTKVDTLKEFLRITKLTPSQIVIFENANSDLVEFNYYLRTLDINYIGVEYLASTKAIGVYNAKVAKFQQDLLLKTGKWVEDDEALRVISTTPNTSTSK